MIPPKPGAQLPALRYSAFKIRNQAPLVPGTPLCFSSPIKRFSIERLADGRAFSLRPGFFRGKIGKNGVRSQKDGKRIGTRPVISGQEK